MQQNEFRSFVGVERVVFDSNVAQNNFENFIRKFGINDVKGNIFVARR